DGEENRMNRRTFVQTVAGAVGAAAALRSDLLAQTQPPAAPAIRRAAAASPAIRIGGNENPYGPGQSALDAIARVASGANRYPGPLIGELASAVAAKFNVPEEMVLLSGGSGDLLNAL